MEKTLLSILTTFLIVISLSTNSQAITFEKTFGSENNESGQSICPTSEGEYVITGSQFNDIFLFKTDANGDSLWLKNYGGDLGSSVKETLDSGYIITGFTSSSGSGAQDVYLIRTDYNGDTLWTKTFGGIRNDQGTSVIEASDSGFVIAGFYSNPFGEDSYEHDVYIIKTDKNGDSLWTRTFGGSNNEAGFSVVEANDGGYVVVGQKMRTDGYNAGWAVYMIKVDIDGNLVWEQEHLGWTYDTFGYSIIRVSGGYMISGTQYTSHGIGHYNLYTLKTFDNGLRDWEKSYSTGSFGRSITQVSDGYVIASGHESIKGGPTDLAITKINNNGDELWVKVFEGSGTSYGYSVCPSSDGDYMITGYTNSYGEGMNDIYLIKIDSDGNVEDLIDTDGDGIRDENDNCPFTANPGQEDADGDAIGDVCDDCTDTDGDGFGDPGFAANTCVVDNCPLTANPGQEDSDLDGVGDACCCIGLRGNVNNDNEDQVDVSDLVFIVDFLFVIGEDPGCPAEANVDGDAGENVDISDLVYLVDFIFTGGPPPPPCP